MKKIIKTKKDVNKIVKTFMKSDFFENCSKKFNEIYKDECLKYVNLFIDKSIPYVKEFIKKLENLGYILSILFIELQKFIK